MESQEIRRKIAERYGGPPESVRSALQQALEASWQAPNKTAAQIANQRSVPSAGAVPTVEEFLRYAETLLEKAKSCPPNNRRAAFHAFTYLLGLSTSRFFTKYSIPE